MAFLNQWVHIEFNQKLKTFKAVKYELEELRRSRRLLDNSASCWRRSRSLETEWPIRCIGGTSRQFGRHLSSKMTRDFKRLEVKLG